MKQDFSPVSDKVLFGNDSVVIVKHIHDIEGGRTLDVTGVTAKVINAGHVIIKDEDGNYKPMPVSGTSYGSLPENHTYVGVLYRSILTSKPAASIMDWGIVNENAAPYPMTAIKSDFIVAVPHIAFTKDEEA